MIEKETGRIEAFSDGIFAVAITLLALEIGIKEPSGVHVTNSDFWHELTDLWPKYLAYFNSFASVLLMWMSHHKIFGLLRSTNASIVLTNGLLLLFTALVPFPAKTVGEYILTDALSSVVIFYTSYSVIMSFVFWLLCLCILRNKENLLPGTGVFQAIKGIYNGITIGLLITIGIVVVAFFSPYIALILNFFTWIFWAGLSYAAEKHAK